MYGSEREILGYRVVMTCAGCPESYIVIDDRDDLIGYLWLREGCFCADYLDAVCETIYEAHPKGDGMFYDDEREFYLTEAVKALHERHVVLNE